MLRSRNQGQSVRCEICRQPVTTFCPNRPANAALGMVHGHCKWCGSKITLNQAKDHLERCPELEVSCQQSQESIKQNEMDAHRSLMMDVVCECGMVTAFTWTLPTTKPNAVMRFPIFKKWVHLPFILPRC